MSLFWPFAVFLALAVFNFLDTTKPLELLGYSYGSFFHYYADVELDLGLVFRTWLVHFLHLVHVALFLAAVFGYASLAGGWLWRVSGRADAFILKIGLGLGGAAIGAWGLGLCGLLDPISIVLLYLPGLVNFAVVVRRGVGREFKDCVAGIEFRDRETRYLFVLIGAMAAVCFLMALGPEGGWDACYYHLRLPKLYAMQHKVYFVPYIYPAGFPQVVEMLFGSVWLLGTEESAKILNFCFMPLAGLALYRLALPLGPRTALRAVAIALALPLVGTEASESYIDLGLSFFVILALLETWKGNFISAGLFMALAMGSKYTGIVTAVSAGLVLVILRRATLRVAFIALVSALAMLPWLVKNWLFTGNPVAPFFHTYLSNLDWAWGIDQIALNRWEPSRLLPGQGEGLQSPLLVGLWSFLETKRFAVLSPLVIGLFPTLLLASSGAYQKFLKFHVLVATVFTLFLSPGAKFYMPVLLPLCVLVALGWRRLADMGRHARIAVSVTAFACMAYGVAYHLLDMQRVLPKVFGVALGLESREDYYATMCHPIGIYDAVKHINSTVPERERVVVISDIQAYLTDRESLFDTDAPDMERWVYLLVKKCASSEDLARQFRQWNARTVLYMRDRAGSMETQEDWDDDTVALVTDFWNSRARKLGEWGPCAVYELGRDPGEPKLQLDVPGPQEVLLVAMDKMELAAKREAYERALARGLESASLHGTFGAWMINARLPGEAAQALRKAVAIDPSHAQFWYWLSAAMAMNREIEEARSALVRAVELEPGNPLRSQMERALGTAATERR